MGFWVIFKNPGVIRHNPKSEGFVRKDQIPGASW